MILRQSTERYFLQVQGLGGLVLPASRSSVAVVVDEPMDQLISKVWFQVFCLICNDCGDSLLTALPQVRGPGGPMAWQLREQAMASNIRAPLAPSTTT